MGDRMRKIVVNASKNMKNKKTFAKISENVDIEKDIDSEEPKTLAEAEFVIKANTKAQGKTKDGKIGSGNE